MVRISKLPSFLLLFLVSCNSLFFQNESNKNKDKNPANTSTPQFQNEMISTTQKYEFPVLPNFLANINSITTISSEFFVTTNGSENGDGSMNNPWDLDSALLGHKEVGPGDILWVRGGTYHPVKEPSKYNIKISGSEDNPVVIRAYPGERVTIDGGIQIYNPNVVFWGFEVFSSDKNNRISEESGSHPSDLNRPGGIGIFNKNIALINNVVHDGEFGISAQILSENAVIYGNLVYNNGWEGPDRGHGHGLYAQNELEKKYIMENIILNNFGGYSYHIYREDGPLNNFIFYGNVSINDTFLVGGIQPASNVTLVENYTYNSTMKLGYRSKFNETVTVIKNHIWNPQSSAFEVNWWNNANIVNNYFYSNKTLSSLQFPNPVNNYNWDNNSYYSETNLSFSLLSSNMTFNNWKKLTGFDSNSNYFSSLPDGQEIIIRPNYFEEKRGHIIIFNWSRNESVELDVSSLGLDIGDNFIIHNAQNFYDETFEGTFDGNPISFPMNGWTVSKPIGWDNTLGENSIPDFGSFVLITAQQ